METLTLEAETSRLLDLVVHSLYTQPQIFLRELISNASDALDRYKYESLLHPELLEDGDELAIHLEVDPEARTLTVRDNGLGMSRDEVISNIGTIARSGTKEFQDGLANRAGTLDLIGRFGVGFYSCFIVAKKVTLLTRRAGEPSGTRWESQGTIHYTVDDAPDASRGTSVTLHLKPADADNEIEDYTDRLVLSAIVKRYADFVGFPIKYIGPRTTFAEADLSPVTESAPITLNSMKPIWARPSAEVSEEEYAEFYRHVSQNWDAPLLRMSFTAEGRWEYRALIFVPAHAPYDLFYHSVEFGLQLYSQRVLIIENCQDLIPRYLRFIKGVVDAADLPLNVSRQTLQRTYYLTAIRKWVSRKVIDTLGKLRDREPEKYMTLWREFGRAIKEGVSEDYENKDRLEELLFFQSSFHPTDLVSLSTYVERMKSDQTDIFFIAGESRASIESSPHIEAALAKGYEVLYFTEPVDELLAQSLREYKGHRLRSLAKGDAPWSDATGSDSPEVPLSDLLNAIGTHLQSRVRRVKLSGRLITSPACLTSDEFGMSPRVERLLNGKDTIHRRVLELNAGHAIIKALHERFAKNPADPVIVEAADFLLSIAILAEGTPLPDAAAFVKQLTNLVARTVDPA
jgi:molecular chaperone HtpG